MKNSETTQSGSTFRAVFAHLTSIWKLTKIADEFALHCEGQSTDYHGRSEVSIGMQTTLIAMVIN